MSPQVVDRVMLALPREPLPAHEVARRANLGICQTYQALVHLYDRGQAFIARDERNDNHGIAGWTA